MNELHEIESYGLLPIVGEDLNTQLDNIERNFIEIMSAEYLRGNDGDNLYCKGIDIKDSEYVEDIKSAILKDSKTPTRTNVDWDENLLADKIYIIYKIKGDEEEIISSLPYTFIDKRFASISDEFDYSNLEDLSCTIMYQDGGFVKLQNFPTIYYDSNVKEFCWRINGQPTGLFARGPKGDSGRNGVCLVVRLEDVEPDTPNSKYAKITQVNIQNEWVGIDKISDYDIVLSPGDTIISTYVEDERVRLILSSAFEDNGVWYANVESEISMLSNEIDLDMLFNTLNLISPLSGGGNNIEQLNGLIIPANGDKSLYHTITSVTQSSPELWIGPSTSAKSPYTEEEMSNYKLSPDKHKYTKLCIAYDDAKFFGNSLIKGHCTVDENCVVRQNCIVENQLIAQKGANILGPFACNPSKDVSILCDEDNIVLQGNKFEVGTENKGIRSENDAELIIDNGESHIQMLSNKININTEEVGIDTNKININAGEVGVDSNKIKYTISGSEYDLQAIFDEHRRLCWKAEFEENISEISTVSFPLTGGISSADIKTFILLRAVDLTSNEDRYNKYYKDGMPVFTDLSNVVVQMKKMSNKDESYRDSHAIEYKIINNSGANRVLKFPNTIRNTGKSTITLEDNHILNLTYTYIEGTTSIYAFTHD